MDNCNPLRSHSLSLGKRCFLRVSFYYYHQTTKKSTIFTQTQKPLHTFDTRGHDVNRVQHVRLADAIDPLAEAAARLHLELVAGGVWQRVRRPVFLGVVPDANTGGQPLQLHVAVDQGHLLGGVQAHPCPGKHVLLARCRPDGPL